MNLSFVIDSENWPDEASLEALAIRARDCLASVLDADEAQDLRQADVTLLFTDDEAQRKLNAEWREQDKTTNVLSFPTPYIPLPEGEMLPLGDISFALETMQREAQEEQKTFDDHLTHLTIHGLLHLLGYDHEDEEEAEMMEAIEIKALAVLNITNPYADF